MIHLEKKCLWQISFRCYGQMKHREQKILKFDYIIIGRVIAGFFIFLFFIFNKWSLQVFLSWELSHARSLLARVGGAESTFEGCNNLRASPWAQDRLTISKLYDWNYFRVIIRNIFLKKTMKEILTMECFGDAVQVLHYQQECSVVLPHLDGWSESHDRIFVAEKLILRYFITKGDSIPNISLNHQWSSLREFGQLMKGGF